MSLCECIPERKVIPLGLQEPPEREYFTDKQKRIDLILHGDGWVIALENKLRHGPDNPFTEYRSAVEKDTRFGNKQKFFVILSPYDPKIEGWKWINYKCFLSHLRDKLGALFVSTGISKWAIFLRELILSIEGQLEQDMDNIDFEFVRDNYSDFIDSISLHEQYIMKVRDIASNAAEEVLGAAPAIVSRQNWHQHGIALRVYPVKARQDNATLLVCPDGKFRIQFYYYVEDDLQNSDAERAAFMANGLFQNWGEESNGKIWVFARDENDIVPALKMLKRALEMLFKKIIRKKTEWP